MAKKIKVAATAMVTATALQFHARCSVIVDGAAARLLQGKEYYRWLFENEPEWGDFRCSTKLEAS